MIYIFCLTQICMSGALADRLEDQHNADIKTAPLRDFTFSITRLVTEPQCCSSPPRIAVGRDRVSPAMKTHRTPELTEFHSDSNWQPSRNLTLKRNYVGKMFHTVLCGWSHVLSSCGNVCSGCMTTKQAASRCVAPSPSAKSFSRGKKFCLFSDDRAGGLCCGRGAAAAAPR